MAKAKNFDGSKVQATPYLYLHSFQKINNLNFEKKIWGKSKKFPENFSRVACAAAAAAKEKNMPEIG